MPGRYYYQVTALPPLGEPGTRPPMSPRDLLEHLRGDPGPRSLVEAVFLSDDLLQREALLVGEIEEASPTVLTVPQLRDEEPLPEFLGPAEDQQPPRYVSDALWVGYYRYVERLAAARGSRFLHQWVRFEVGLRNALAAARAKALTLDPDDYLVVPELGDGPEAFEAVVAEWAAARDPLAGLRVLDRRRWDWIGAHDAWFSFDQDELAAYAVRVMLLNRWQRLREGDADRPPSPAAATDDETMQSRGTRR
ncbi:MAG TPA: hypothetical protein VMZ50_09860 [Phycisphaerae bacterium]|nr:hypothetical protein [Phycisphaerae bacterium]